MVSKCADKKYKLVLKYLHGVTIEYGERKKNSKALSLMLLIDLCVDGSIVGGVSVVCDIHENLRKKCH